MFYFIMIFVPKKYIIYSKFIYKRVSLSVIKSHLIQFYKYTLHGRQIFCLILEKIIFYFTLNFNFFSMYFLPLLNSYFKRLIQPLDYVNEAFIFPNNKLNRIYLFRRG